MLAEVLLLLSGHPSTFFAPHDTHQSGTIDTLAVTPSLAAYLHPGEVAALNTLGQLAWRYAAVRSWTRRVQDATRAGILESHLSRNGAVTEAARARSGKGRAGDETPPADAYLSVLVNALVDVLKEYEQVAVEFETKVLELDPEVVQDAHRNVPLSSVLAAFDEWQPIMAALHALVVDLSSAPTIASSSSASAAVNAAPPRWTPGLLIAHLAALQHTGHPRLREIYTTILSSLTHLFLTHLAAFVLHGLAPPAGTVTPLDPALGLDMGADALSPQHRTYALNEDLVPPILSGKVRESVLYVGRVAATLRREGRTLPGEMVKGLKAELMQVTTLGEDGGLERAITRARAEVGEWLWKNVLSGPRIRTAIQAFGHYFLLRRADYALSLVRELHRLRVTRLITSNPKSSASVIREADLDVATLRASLATSAEDDGNLEMLAWTLPNGPLRPIMPPAEVRRTSTSGPAGREKERDKEKDKVLDMFSPSVLGTPLELKARVSWPLDLFMTPASVRAYTEIHAYLFALRDAHTRVLDTWSALSGARRRRRTVDARTGDKQGARSRSLVSRTAWATIRAMLFFLDQLQGHFMSDIIHVQHRHLLDELDAYASDDAQKGDVDEDGIKRPTSIGGGGNVSPSASVSRSDRLGSLGGVRKSWSRSSLRDLRSEAADSAPRPGSPQSDAESQTGTVRSARLRPPTPHRAQDSYLDFLTLRQMHTRHLQLLREGLLLTDIVLLGIIREIIDTCKRLAGLVERWGGDVGSDTLGDEEVAREMDGRLQAVQEVKRTLHDLMSDFYRALLESQHPSSAGRDDASSTGTHVSRSTAGTGTLAARTMQMSRAVSSSRFGVSGITGKSRAAGSGARGGEGEGKGKGKAEGERAEKSAMAEAMIGRHAEQRESCGTFSGSKGVGGRAERAEAAERAVERRRVES